MITADDIDLVSPETFATRGHPWEQYAWLRANAPVFWHREDPASG
ncbi:MAG: cytochrome P450, partial [Actinobacteria bacterium]|nr:cytochrome P450 [Actinomycetota bacterium]